MKKKVKKLQLNRETISPLGSAVGGYRRTEVDTCDSGTCGTGATGSLYDTCQGFTCYTCIPTACPG